MPAWFWMHLEGHAVALIGDVGHGLRAGEPGAQHASRHPDFVDAGVGHPHAAELRFEVDHRLARVRSHRRCQLEDPDHILVLAHLVLNRFEDRVHEALLCHCLSPRPRAKSRGSATDQLPSTKTFFSPSSGLQIGCLSAQATASSTSCLRPLRSRRPWPRRSPSRRSGCCGRCRPDRAPSSRAARAPAGMRRSPAGRSRTRRVRRAWHRARPSGCSSGRSWPRSASGPSPARARSTAVLAAL